MDDNIAISVRNVSKYFKMFGSANDRFKEFLLPGKKSFHKKFWALQDVSFEVEKGTTFGIIGQNGSGKSTLLQIISGIIRPSSGEVSVNGRISALLQLGAGFHRDFSGRENVFMQGALMGISREEMEKNYEKILEFADIGSFINQPVKTYSSGMYVRLAFATSVNIDPDVLIVDEVLAVGDDVFKRRCFRKIEEFQEEGKTILFVSHNLPTVMSLCRSALLIDKAKMVQIGITKDVVNTYSKMLAEREEEYLNRTIQKISIDSNAKEYSTEHDKNISLNSDDEFRYGTNEAEIIDFYFENENSEQTSILEAGQTCSIYSTSYFKESFDDVTMGITFKTLQGIEVFGVSTYLTSSKIGAVKANSKVVVKFELPVMLNPGSYMLSVTLSKVVSSKAYPLDRRIDAMSFRVAGDYKAYGLVNIPTEITVNKTETIQNTERTSE